MIREIFLQIIKSKDLRNRILFTLGVFVFIRFIAHIPLPQIDKAQLANFLGQSQNQVFGVLSLFTGGSISRLSIDMLGVGPYITGSIIIQLLTKAIPSWEAISKEGESGREKLNQYSRYLAVPLGLIQGYGTIALLKSQNVLNIASSAQMIEILMVITATSLFVMWMGELISEKGIGNGISLVIALGIIAGLPQQFSNTAAALQAGQYLTLIGILLVAVLTVTVIVIVNEAERKIPITYARRGSGPTASSVDSYLPLRINTAGVIPIIFALSFLTFPAVIARFLTTAKSDHLVSLANHVTDFLANHLYYGIAYFLLVFAFTFFYTYIVMEPRQVAENLQKQSGFIPGIRPGNETASFLNYTITRITVIGALFLALIAILPLVIQQATGLQTLVIGGTSILIVVSVIIDTGRQILSQVSMRRYDAVS
jgi:preprotein translocase subunit SecY